MRFRRLCARFGNANPNPTHQCGRVPIAHTITNRIHHAHSITNRIYHTHSIALAHTLTHCGRFRIHNHNSIA